MVHFEGSLDISSYVPIGISGRTKIARKKRECRLRQQSEGFRKLSSQFHISQLPKIQGSRKNAWTCFEGPFGEVIRATGPMAKANPFRFSTKYQDDETDLLYYGYRFYSASTGRWLSRDPLASQSLVLQHIPVTGRFRPEDPDLTPTAFVRNNPNTYIDGLGLWPSQYHVLGLIWWPVPETHQHSALRAIPDLAAFEDSWLIGGDISVDSAPGNQDTVNSFMHAMKAPYQSEADARRRANQFVRDHLTKAQELLCKSCGRGTTRNLALWEFGMALHTVQDYTSPAHHFQTWHGTFPLFDAIDHLQAEYYDPGPNSNLDKATKWLWTFFECEYGAPPMPDDFFRNLDWDPPR